MQRFVLVESGEGRHSSEEGGFELVDLDRPILFGEGGCTKIEQFSTFKGSFTPPFLAFSRQGIVS